MKLNIATCQFPVNADIRQNLRCILHRLEQAHTQHAHVAHFPEGALSGYAGVNFASFADFNWDLLIASSQDILAAARRLGLWVVFGSCHRLQGRHKPHNSVYVVNPQGKIVNRYDKRFTELEHFSPGNHWCTFKIQGLTCGVLICHDFRYPELYRQYKLRNVKLMFHSFHNAAANPQEVKKFNLYRQIVPAAMQCYAANNHMYISAANSSRRASYWPAFFVRPDGIITGKLTNNRSGLLMSTLNTEQKYFDGVGDEYKLPLRGLYHNGKVVNDPKSKCRTAL